MRITNTILEHMNYSFTGLTVSYFMTADKLVPYDGMPRTAIDSVATPPVVVVFLLAAAGIIFAVGCSTLLSELGCSTLLSERQSIHNVSSIDFTKEIIILLYSYIYFIHNFANNLSRPRLNYLITVGVFLFYTSMILFAVPTNSKSVLLAFFKVWPWTLSLGFSFCYGTIIMKMFRALSTT